jgi:hypothetical protein
MKIRKSFRQFKQILLEYESMDEYVLSSNYTAFIEEYNAGYTEAQIVFAVSELTCERTEYDLAAISLVGLRQSDWMLCKPLKIYAPVFDERIFTEKLLGKPSPGLPPPSSRAAV